MNRYGEFHGHMRFLYEHKGAPDPSREKLSYI